LSYVLFMMIELIGGCSQLISHVWCFVWVHCGSFGRCLLDTLLYQCGCLVVVSQFRIATHLYWYSCFDVNVF
jgi:hypothetical protein